MNIDVQLLARYQRIFFCDNIWVIRNGDRDDGVEFLDRMPIALQNSIRKVEMSFTTHDHCFPSLDHYFAEDTHDDRMRLRCFTATEKNARASSASSLRLGRRSFTLFPFFGSTACWISRRLMRQMEITLECALRDGWWGFPVVCRSSSSPVHRPGFGGRDLGYLCVEQPLKGDVGDGGRRETKGQRYANRRCFYSS